MIGTKSVICGLACALFTIGIAAQEAGSGPVGHWKFDEEKIETTVEDASGNNQPGQVVKSPVQVEGHFGKALSFDGGGSQVKITDSPALKKLENGSYTISLWFHPTDTPPGQGQENNALYTLVAKGGEGLLFTAENRFVMQHWLVSEKPGDTQWVGAATWYDTFEPGSWYHVVGVVDRAAGETRIYVDGELRNMSEAWTPNARAQSFSPALWRIGAMGETDKLSFPAKAAMDDVRLYNRALTSAEIEALYKEEPATEGDR